jgi:hypothetical protein
VGIVATDFASQNPEAIELVSIREGNSPLARTIRTECPSAKANIDPVFETAKSINRSYS